MQVQVSSTGAQATARVAEKIGHKLRGGEIIELISDLGGGKTTFVRGLARGMGSHDAVRSPSFTLANQYRSKDLTLHHFDFYRLDDPGIVAHELAEVITDPKAVVVVEWSKIVKQVLTAPHLVVTIQQTGEQRRDMDFVYPKQYNYLFEA